MKFLERKSIVLLYTLIVAIGLGFSSCNADDEDIVVPKSLEEYKTELNDIVASEKVVVQNCVVGYNKGDFKNELYFVDYTYDYMFALVSAEKILAKPDLIIADVMAANKMLTSPGKAFNDNLFISDRRPLNDLIGICDTLRVHTFEGIEPGMAPAEARNQFKLDINDAKSVRDRSTTIDRQVSEAVEKLNLDLTKFKNAIIK